MPAVMGTACDSKRAGRRKCGQGGVEMHVGEPEAEKGAVGILFYILIRRLPALTP